MIKMLLKSIWKILDVQDQDKTKNKRDRVWDETKTITRYANTMKFAPAIIYLFPFASYWLASAG